MQQPAWINHAWRELGQRETPGPVDNHRIIALYADAGHPDVRHDEVAWCAAFVGACLHRAGIHGSRSLLARSYLHWGQAATNEPFGAVAVFPRGTDPAAGHTGFLIGADDETLIVLGGNQGNAVSVARFPRGELLALRWPSGTAAQTVPSVDSSLFEQALAHVLEMEGGWSDDPHDPGGPTNRGITLATFAAFRGLTVTAANRESLVAGLRAISPGTVRSIYFQRYWRPSTAANLPPAVGFMHFDASVNHGVTGAARLLQQAVGAPIDGEIGPVTMGEVGARDADTIVRAYADARRARYRALPHYWRFGRGWLARVDRTLVASLALTRRSQSPRTFNHTSDLKEQPMTTRSNETSEPNVDPKWWGHSMTIWGTLITTLATVLPAIGPLIGLDLTAELIRALGEHAVRAVQSVGGLIGVLMTIYGRARAAQPLVRRDVTMRL